MKTSACGTFVSLSMPYISSTPDRVVDDNIILKVKCPYICRTQAISEATNLRNVNGELYLDQNHDYYYQVQGQMFCCNRKLCHFVVYTFENIKFIEVKRDGVFIQGMLENLTRFYNNYFRQ